MFFIYISLSIVASLSFKRHDYISTVKRFKRLYDDASNSYILIFVIICLTGGGGVLSALTYSSSGNAASAEKLEPLKVPLLLDSELDTSVSSGF